jgi:hypothetical protein
MSLLSAPNRSSFNIGLLATASLTALIGCSMGSTAPGSADPAVPTRGFAVQGNVHGGQQPITGATIQLYAAGAPPTGGDYGAGAVALIPTGSYFPGGASGCVTGPNITCTTLPTTDSTGGFTITGDYTCPSASSQIYIVATGGNPGIDGTTNPYISMMSALGACNTATNSSGQPVLSPSLYISINEVSTLASVYALQNFMSAPVANTVEGIGAPGTLYNHVQTGVVGLTNAFSMIPNLFNISTGTSPGTNSTFLVETTQINTLADILAYCVNSDPAATSNCSTLMAAATPSGATVATDTLQAAYYMAHNPYHNVPALFALVSSTPPFTANKTAPYDFTLGVQVQPTYSNAGVISPAIAVAAMLSIDAYGNVWVLNRGANSSGTNNTFTVPGGVTELSPTGATLLGPIGAYTAQTTGYGAYSEFTTFPTSNVRTFNIASVEGNIAIDMSNNVWVTDNRDATPAGSAPAAGSVAYLQGSTGPGAAPSGSITGYYTGGGPDGIAIDGNNNVFIASVSSNNASDYSVDEFVNGSGTSYTYSENGKPANTYPYRVFGGATKVALGQFSTITNTYGGATFANDGSLLWVAAYTGCSISGSTTLGSFEQYTSRDLLPTANSVIASSAGTTAGTSLCPAAQKVVSTFNAPTANTYNLAIDRYDRVWTSDNYLTATNGFDGVTLLAPDPTTGLIDPNTGSATYNAGAPGSSTYSADPTKYGLKDPYGIAIDGNNNAWVGNQSINTVFVIGASAPSAGVPPTLTPIAVPTGPNTKHPLSTPQFPAIDPSGNVWIVNQTDPAGEALGLATAQNIGTTLTILIGAAAPVVTPIAVATASKVLGTKP